MGDKKKKKKKAEETAVAEVETGAQETPDAPSSAPPPRRRLGRVVLIGSVALGGSTYNFWVDGFGGAGLTVAQVQAQTLFQ